MYNEALKKRFIKEQVVANSKSVDYIGHVASIFNSCEKFEIEWGADLCTRTAEELEPMVESIVGLRSRSKWSRIILLKSYVRWCLAINVPGATDGMLTINNVGLSKIREQMISSPEHLQKCLNEILDPESEETIDNTYRCFYWMAYGGIEEDDIFEIRASDIDLHNKVIHYKGKTIELYRQSWPAFENAVKLTQFRYKNLNYSPDIIKYRDRVDGDQLIRGIRSNAHKMTLRSELSKRSAKFYEAGATSVILSYKRVALSGLFYRTYQMEAIDGHADFHDASVAFMQGKEYKLDSGRNSLEAKKRQIENDYMQDYLRWKVVFY